VHCAATAAEATDAKHCSATLAVAPAAAIASCAPSNGKMAAHPLRVLLLVCRMAASAIALASPTLDRIRDGVPVRALSRHA